MMYNIPRDMLFEIAFQLGSDCLSCAALTRSYKEFAFDMDEFGFRLLGRDSDIDRWELVFDVPQCRSLKYFDSDSGKYVSV